MVLSALPSYSCISGLLPDFIADLIDESTVDIKPWKCRGIYRGEVCDKTIGTYTVPAFGMQMHMCHRCGHLNVLVNGFPLK